MTVTGSTECSREEAYTVADELRKVADRRYGPIMSLKAAEWRAADLLDELQSTLDGQALPAASIMQPSEEEKAFVREWLAIERRPNRIAALLRKYVLQEQSEDPLVEVLKQHLTMGTADWNQPLWEDMAKSVREALARRGLSIKEGV